MNFVDELENAKKVHRNQHAPHRSHSSRSCRALMGSGALGDGIGLGALPAITSVWSCLRRPTILIVLIVLIVVIV